MLESICNSFMRDLQVRIAARRSNEVDPTHEPNKRLDSLNAIVRPASRTIDKAPTFNPTRLLPDALTHWISPALGFILAGRSDSHRPRHAPTLSRPDQEPDPDPSHLLRVFGRHDLLQPGHAAADCRHLCGVYRARRADRDAHAARLCLWPAAVRAAGRPDQPTHPDPGRAVPELHQPAGLGHGAVLHLAAGGERAAGAVGNQRAGNHSRRFRPQYSRTERRG